MISTKLKFILAAVLVSISAWSWAQTAPVPMLQSVADQIIATLKQNKAQLKSNPNVIYQAVQRSLLPHVDVNGMSRSVLGRQAWNQATPAERQQFTQEFTQLVIRTYSSPLAEYSDETVKFLPVRSSENAKFIRVNSMIIRSSGKTIPLTYSLVAKGNDWKIYDLSVEGVSLLQSFRSQFSQVLRNSNMQSLIAEMKKQKRAA